MRLDETLRPSGWQIGRFRAELKRFLLILFSQFRSICPADGQVAPRNESAGPGNPSAVAGTDDASAGSNSYRYIN
jgi:hypothetical protein